MVFQVIPSLHFCLLCEVTSLVSNGAVSAHTGQCGGGPWCGGGGGRRGRPGVRSAGEAAVHSPHPGVPQRRSQGHQARSRLPGKRRRLFVHLYLKVPARSLCLSTVFTISFSRACRRCCGWFRARLCRFPVPASSSRSSRPCSSGRTSVCLSPSSRRPFKRFK